MVDSGTATELAAYTPWWIPLLSAIGGAVVALIGKEFIEWYRRPRFDIDFEERAGQKPYIPDLNDETLISAGDVHRVKSLRLKVQNKGKTPAMNCEAKLLLSVKGGESSTVVLHWARRDPALYSTYSESGTLAEIKAEKVFEPISLNVNEDEPVDVFHIRYSFSTLPNTDNSPRFAPIIESASLRPLQLSPRTPYDAKVTIYSSNAMPKSFSFKVNWDGTLEGFAKAFK